MSTLLNRQIKINQVYGELIGTLNSSQASAVDSSGLSFSDPIGHKLKALRELPDLSNDTKFYINKLERMIKGD